MNSKYFFISKKKIYFCNKNKTKKDYNYLLLKIINKNFIFNYQTHIRFHCHYHYQNRCQKHHTNHCEI
jgi:hypothetical protein